MNLRQTKPLPIDKEGEGSPIQMFLDIARDHATSDGESSNCVVVRIIQARRPVPGKAVAFSAQELAQVTPAGFVTDHFGQAYCWITSTKDATCDVYATCEGVQAAVSVTFTQP